MTINWQPSINNGGSNITGYFVEKKDRNSILWSRCTYSNLSATASECKITGLERGLEYVFRVTAVNKAGNGKASKASEPEVAREIIDSPTALECLSVGRDYVTLKWVKPEFDGGAKIVGYIVERRERQNIQWLRCNF